MNRRQFIASVAGGVMASLIPKQNNEKMPAVFLGHGSPMNAIDSNPFTAFLSQLGQSLPRPRAILAVSAHWQTPGTRVLKIETPDTIHDFYGFPPELFALQYPAPGSLAVADRVAALLKAHEAQADNKWGLDHGTWSLLVHLYPQADIPVLQLSLNENLSLREHLVLAHDLQQLRNEGVLLLGSGNITHNLRQVDWSPQARPIAWAVEFDEMIKTALEERNYHTLLAGEASKHSLWRQALPSLEHYLPLLYVVGAASEHERASFPYEGMQMGSLSMRAVRFG